MVTLTIRKGLTKSYSSALSKWQRSLAYRRAEEDVRADYMNSLFKAGLTRSINDAANLPRGEHMDALAGQAIVFARLAGFLAGQFPPETDLFRTISGAMLDAHSEPAALL